jgi:capsular exopolysaccharide synthesis family protein
MEMSQSDRPLKTILVSSADIGDGKSSVAANLALSIAQREKEVVLVDGDLRRPNIHKLFELKNERGLVDLVSDGAVIGDVLQYKDGSKVALLPSGDVPNNPAEILSSKKMDQLLSKLQETADVVIIDGPPFIVADAMILAAKVDGVLLVVRPGRTRRSLAEGAVEQIKLAGAKVVGVVLNRIPLRGADYYAGKRYVESYYLSNYGDELEMKQRDIDLENLPQTLMRNIAPYAHKTMDSIGNRFPKASKFTKFIKTAFKPSPK